MNQDSVKVVNDGVSILKSYFTHLANSPERIDSLLMWTVCTIFAWAVMVVYRERIVRGLEGLNQLFEGGEFVVLVAVVCFPPILFNVAFFKAVEMYQWYALLFEGGILGYALMGRYIFDWALAFKTGQSSVPKVDKDEEKK